MNEVIGSALKLYRKKQNMTLQALADKSSLSVSYISMLERGLNSPTIENLNKICRALNITVSDLINDLPTGDLITVKKNERQMILNSDGCTVESASKGRRQMSSTVMTIYDNKMHMSSAHIADEIGYVSVGSLIMTVGGVEHDLEEGDCIYIPANQPHSFRKTCEGPCVTFWVYGAPASTLEIDHTPSFSL